jgi:hypothetical protein
MSALAFGGQTPSRPRFLASISIPSGKRKFYIKQNRTGCAMISSESGAVSLLLLLLARAGVINPGSLFVYEGPAEGLPALFAYWGAE